MYIQDKVEEYSDIVFDLLDKGAHIYFVSALERPSCPPSLPLFSASFRACVCRSRLCARRRPPFLTAAPLPPSPSYHHHPRHTQCGLKGMMPGIQQMLERVATEKGINFEEYIEKLKHGNQWHVEVY